MSNAIVTVPVAPVRVKANHKSEMSNQIFFGERVKILKQKDEMWLYVESEYDQYKGWLTTHLVTIINDLSPVPKTPLLAPDFINQLKFDEKTMQVPMGATLPGLNKKKGIIAGKQYTFNGKPLITNAIVNKAEQLITNAHQWLNAPYMWGGKTILGVDCSGFCQTMYKLIGLPIARDARQQALQGKKVKKLELAQPADLAFFDENDDIIHVGILLGPDRIIHSAGNVRIDYIDKKGITNSDTGKRTHHLKLIKRIL